MLWCVAVRVAVCVAVCAAGCVAVCCSVYCSVCCSVLQWEVNAVILSLFNALFLIGTYKFVNALQCVAACVAACDAACVRSVLQDTGRCCGKILESHDSVHGLQSGIAALGTCHVAACCSMLQRVAARCSVLQCTAMCF